jgi:hypothetical protein
MSGRISHHEVEKNCEVLRLVKKYKTAEKFLTADFVRRQILLLKGFS